MEQRLLSAFVSVSEHAHFGQAAESLGISQSALSRAVLALEEWAGTRLFVRTSRRVELTPAGVALLPRARQVLLDLEAGRQAAQLASAGFSGRLGIGYMDLATTDFLPALVARFKLRCPDVDVSLSYGWRSRQLADLMDERLDIGFLVGPVVGSRLEVHPVKSYDFVAILPRFHALAERQSIELAELAGNPFVLGVRREWQSLWDRLEALCADRGFLPDVVQEAPNRDVIFGYVAAGLGVTVFPDTARSVLRPDLVAVPVADVSPGLEVVAACRRRPTPLVARFLDELRAYCNDASGATNVPPRAIDPAGGTS